MQEPPGDQDRAGIVALRGMEIGWSVASCEILAG